MWLLTPALAGTIQVHADLPIGVKLDEAWVVHSGTTVTMTDVDDGLHRVTVCNLMGKPVATVDVRVGDGPVQLRYAEKRLERLERLERVEPAPADEDAAADPLPIDASSFSELQRELLKGSAKARMQVLTEAVAVHWFQMRHVEQLVASFERLDDQVEAARVLAPRTLDPQNVGVLDQVLPDGAHRDEAKAAFSSPPP